MKKFLVVDMVTLLPMGIYQAEAENKEAITSNHELSHVEISEDFHTDAYEIVKENGKIKLVKK